MMGFGMGFGLVGILVMVLFWGLLIFGAVWLVRSLFPSGGGSVSLSRGDRASAREILDLRYARGEIDREQYEAMKKDLEA